MNNIDKIYQELGDNICLFPFFGAFYQTNNVARPGESPPNSVRPCSVILSADPKKWDIQNNSIQNARNSDAWCGVRRQFVEGTVHDIPDCSACSYNEKSGATSARRMNNAFYADHLDIDIIAETKKIINNNYLVEDIVTMDYYPSNYCNYECIMCAGGASSKRQTFEVKYKFYETRVVLNDVDPDFYQALRTVKIINFTGGETMLQEQVTTIIDYLIEHDLAKNIRITLLTNASHYPEKLIEKFKNFKSVFYTVSIDGVGPVIEYQRRGAIWSKVEDNAIRLLTHEFIGAVINCVLTAANVLNIAEFLIWAHSHGFNKIAISPVFREDQLSQAAVPPELKKIAIDRLEEARKLFSGPDRISHQFSGYVDQTINVIERTEYQQSMRHGFIKHIAIEDQVSKRKFLDIVPEWQPYFNFDDK